MDNRDLPWVRRILGRRVESEVNRRLAIVVRTFSARREDGRGGRPISDPGRVAAEAERRLLQLDQPAPGAEQMFARLARQLVESGYVEGVGELSPEAVDGAARLDALIGGHGLEPLLKALDEVRRFHAWVEAYLDNTGLAEPDAQLAVKLAERLWFLGSLTAVGRADGQFPHATRELTAEITSGARTLQPANWGVARAGSTAAPSGVGLWAANQLGHNNETKIRTVCRALAVHLVGQIATRSDDTDRRLVVASPLFDPAYTQRALDRDTDLEQEFEEAIYMALRAGWHVVHVLSRQGQGAGGVPRPARPEPATPLDVGVELVVAVLVNLITPGVYEPVIEAPLTTPDVIVAHQTAAVSFLTPASPNPGRAWLPRAVIRAVHWGPRQEMATETVRGLYEDVLAELDEVMAVGERAADGDPYMQKWTTRTDLLLPVDGLLAFDRTLTVSELIPGDRWCIKGGMSSSTLPDSSDGAALSLRQIEAWKAEVAAMMHDGPRWEAALADTPELRAMDRAGVLARIDGLAYQRSIRQFALRTNCADHRYRDLIPADYVEAYATSEGLGDPEAPSAVYSTRHLTLADRRLHLASVRDHLRATAARIERFGPDAPGYRLALTRNLPFNLDDTWLVITASQDRRADQVHFVHRDRSLDRRILAILRPTALERFDLRRSFVALFDALWATPSSLTDPALVADRIDELLGR